MQLTIVTGMSGAGKTQALRFFEDMGYFCIDNLPPVLLPKLTELYGSVGGEKANVVLVIDARAGDKMTELLDHVKKVRLKGQKCEILFLDCNDETLVKRYKETRRTHPVESKDGLLSSITKERSMLRDLYNGADIVIDTSTFKLRDLYNTLRGIYTPDSQEQSLNVHIMAFGFKYGAPLEADLVFDVRCLPNPFYIEELKYKTGNDKVVQDYVMQFEESKQFLRKIEDLAEFSLPLYAKEGKPNLTVALGCTGGKHRSVTFANKLASYVKGLGYNVNTIYRDIDKE